MSGDKATAANKPAGPDTTSAHVSLFPSPPWQLINKLHNGNSDAPPPRPPTPPGSSSTYYRMFGTMYNPEDPIIRPLEVQNARRVYPQNCNKKRELRKLNFSILAAYLDLLELLTQDPDSPRRTEKLSHIAILFINMHHLINEYRQHQARDLVREVLRHQVNVASTTVAKAEYYLSHADQNLASLAHELTAKTSDLDTLISDVNDPSLSSLLQTLLDQLVSTAAADPSTAMTVSEADRDENDLSATSEADDILADMARKSHIDPELWAFLTKAQEEEEGAGDVVMADVDGDGCQ